MIYIGRKCQSKAPGRRDALKFTFMEECVNVLVISLEWRQRRPTARLQSSLPMLIVVAKQDNINI